MWFHFDEVFGSMYEMKLGNKDMSLYLVDEKEYCPAGSFQIEHQGWAYLPPLGAFIPTRYLITMETEAGVLEMTATAVGATPWGVTGKVPETAGCDAELGQRPRDILVQGWPEENAHQRNGRHFDQAVEAIPEHSPVGCRGCRLDEPGGDAPDHAVGLVNLGAQSGNGVSKLPATASGLRDHSRFTVGAGAAFRPR